MASSSQERAIQRITSVAQFMDSQFRIPGTSIRFGLDPVLSIIPVAGSMVSYVVAAYLVLEMAMAGASGKVVVKMILNIVLDAIIGSIPFIGFIPDVFYKANIRNLKLLREHYQEGRHQGSGLSIVVIVLGVLLGITGLIIFGMVALMRSLF